MSELRKNYGRIRKILDPPNLIDIQIKSYEKFLQVEVDPGKRGNYGLRGAFNSVFPISDFSGRCSLEFVDYRIKEARYDVGECIQKGMTYAAPLRIVVRLVVFDTERGSEQKHIRDIKEQEIYFGEIPLMTENGTFIVNGTERVIVSQLHRSPGIFFDHDKGKTVTSGKIIYSSRIIPIRGSWLDLEFDSKDLLYVRIDRRRKMPVTILLKALGKKTEDILKYFYETEAVFIEEGKLYRAVDKSLEGEKAIDDVVVPATGEVLFRKGKKINKTLLRKAAEAGITRILVQQENIVGKTLQSNVLDPKTQEVLVGCNEALTLEGLNLLKERGVDSLHFVHLDEDLDNLS
ncbi:MAG: DNA-directed RNA polymerase subunit beta, partial [Smithellaceae bacterium]|nr:DNA-directed RNA polymerase subunit beta [Smithellaceae bacterium]